MALASVVRSMVCDISRFQFQNQPWLLPFRMGAAPAVLPLKSRLERTIRKFVPPSYIVQSLGLLLFLEG